MPSWISPSPSSTYILPGSLLSLFAIAIPPAAANPCPSEPVDISIPGTLFISGCPWNFEPSFLSVMKSSTGKYPFRARAEYCTGPACPFERMNLSLPSIFGFFGSTFISLKYSAVTISAAESEPPGWPDPALCMAFTTPTLTSAAVFSRAFISIASSMFYYLL